MLSGMGELARNSPKEAESLGIMSETALGACPVSWRVSGFTVPKIGPRNPLILNDWNCANGESGQNHRRSKGVEPGTRFSALLDRWIEIDRAVLRLHWRGGMGH
jgi:hypothetical protein